MGPIKKYLWNRKFKKKVGRDVRSALFLQVLAKLDLWRPTEEREFKLMARVALHNTLKEMVTELEF